MEKIETLFDHDPSAEELSYLFLAGMTREEYLASPRDPEMEFGHIYALYMIRGQRETALKYLERIRDPKEHFSPKPNPTRRPNPGTEPGTPPEP